MPQDIAATAPTSSAATRETEPEVVAGISSAEGNPGLPLSFRIGGIEFPVGRTLALVGIGAALGFAATRLLGRRADGTAGRTKPEPIEKSPWF